MALGVFVDDENVLDMLAHEAERGAKPALSAANDDDIVDRLARISVPGTHPGARRIIEAFEIVAHRLGEPG